MHYTSGTVADNTIMENRVDGGGGGGGIGSMCFGGAVLNNTIAQNYPFNGHSGGILLDTEPLESHVTIKNNILTENWADVGGGGISANFCAPVVVNNIIHKNATAVYGGGGIYFYDYYTPRAFANNTITENLAPWGGGILLGDVASLDIVNSIFWKNGASAGFQIYMECLTDLNISHSDVEGGQSKVHVGPHCVLNWDPA